MEKQGGIFGENGDAALALEVVGVHYALDERLIGAENAALAEHSVHQGGFAMIDVSDDGDIANVVAHVGKSVLRQK